MPIFEPGQLFGSYRLVAPLSRGGMGEVWRALKVGAAGVEWSRQVALKVILPGFADSDQFAEFFASEARIAAGLVHANIVAVSNFGRENGILFLEQELVDGADLGKLIARVATGFPQPIAIFIIVEALKGLAYAHNHQLPDGRPQMVIHRDIKPANVLVAREGHVKLADFGVARITSRTNPSMTELRGTIGYIAPELLEGKPPSPRSDLFAMGLVFWELLTGRKLFAGDNEAARLLKTFECVIPRLADFGVQAPPQLEAIVRTLLARDPAARFQTAEDALHHLLEAPGGRDATSLELKAYLASLGIEGLPSIDLPSTRGHKPSRTLTLAGQVSTPGSFSRFFNSKVVLAVLVALAGLGLTAVFTLRPSHKPASIPTAAAPAPSPPAPPAATTKVDVPPVDAAPRLSRVTIEVAPADAQVTADGRLLQGPPFILDAVPGKTLTLHVDRQGYEPSDKGVPVEGGPMTVRVALQELPKAAPEPDAGAQPQSPAPQTASRPPQTQKKRPPSSNSKPAAPKTGKDRILLPSDDEEP